MKISTRKIDILIIFVIFILVETISLATYQNVLAAENDKENKMTEMESVIEQEEAELSEEEKETLNLINEYREQNNLNKLKPFSQLQKVAKLKAKDLVTNQYFSHISENLGTPFEMLKNNGIKYKIAGENLAGNTTPQKAVKAWIDSTTHRENILEGKFEYTGICVIESPIYGKVFVQLFIGL